MGAVCATTEANQLDNVVLFISPVRVNEKESRAYIICGVLWIRNWNEIGETLNATWKVWQQAR
jgi:hypothetical protein